MWKKHGYERKGRERLMGMNGDAVRKGGENPHDSMNEFAVKDVRVNKNTVVDWYMFCREVCMAAVLKESEPLGGEGKIVEIDEIMFGKMIDHHIVPSHGERRSFVSTDDKCCCSCHLSDSQIEAHEIHSGNGLYVCLSLAFSLEHHTGCEDLLGSHFENENDFESKKNQ
ncbi:hypothetical protein TNCV_2752131 [Trichonephila clavipes]|nr:hypothetical protein TNCV_2752131 [Trichonephila clavipes]